MGRKDFLIKVEPYWNVKPHGIQMSAVAVALK